MSKNSPEKPVVNSAKVHQENREELKIGFWFTCRNVLWEGFGEQQWTKLGISEVQLADTILHVMLSLWHPQVIKL